MQRVATLEKDMVAVKAELARPLVTVRQTIIGVCSAAGLIFAAGAWAQSTTSTLTALTAGQIETKNALARLERVPLLEEKISKLEAEVDRLRIRQR